MKNDNYKDFKEGDYIVCIKEGICVYPKLFDDRMDGKKLKLHKTYIVDRYLTLDDGSKIYDALVLKGYTLLHDGKNFMLLSEFRKMKLKRLKRKLRIKKIIEKFVFFR